LGIEVDGGLHHTYRVPPVCLQNSCIRIHLQANGAQALFVWCNGYYESVKLTQGICLASLGLLLCSELDAVSNRDQPHLAEDLGYQIVIRDGPQFMETLTPRDAQGPVLFDSAGLPLLIRTTPEHNR
jgi:hypothetical protein